MISLKKNVCIYSIVNIKGLIHLEYSNPVLWMWSDELRQGVVTFQRCVGKVTLPHVLEDDVGKV